MNKDLRPTFGLMVVGMAQQMGLTLDETIELIRLGWQVKKPPPKTVPEPSWFSGQVDHDVVREVVRMRKG